MKLLSVGSIWKCKCDRSGCTTIAHVVGNLSFIDDGGPGLMMHVPLVVVRLKGNANPTKGDELVAYMRDTFEKEFREL